MLSTALIQNYNGSFEDWKEKSDGKLYPLEMRVGSSGLILAEYVIGLFSEYSELSLSKAAIWDFRAPEPIILSTTTQFTINNAAK